MSLPQSLYKYQSFTPNSLANIVANQIWFSPPDVFNDPFDCAIRIETAPIPEEDFEKIFQKFISESDDPDGLTKRFKPAGVLTEDFKQTGRRSIAKGFEDKRKQMRTERGIACFSARYDQILMWSHYAASHTGFCLEFSTSKEPFLRAFPVIYEDDVPSVNPAPMVLEEQPEVLRTMVTTKSSCWNYEEEWRLFHMQPRIGFGYTPETLTGVYFGALMPELHRLLLGKLLHGTSTKLHQTEFDPSRFALNSTPLRFVPLV